MIRTRKKKSHNKRQLSQLDENLNDFVIASGTTVNIMRNGDLELQAKGYHESLGGIVKGASQNQVIGSNTDDRIKNAVDSAVIVVKNCMYDAILTAMNNVMIPRVDMAVRLITCSSRSGPNSLVQNPDQKDFTGNTKNTPLRSAFSRLDLNVEQDEKDETRDIDNSEDRDFPATRLRYDRRAHTHHKDI